MSIEIKTMDIANEAEELCINLYQSFGWKLKSSQRVFNQTSRPVGTISAGNVAYVHSETETVDFTKLVFERETTMENYGKLCQLEREYFNLVDALPDNPPAYSSDISMDEWGRCERPNVSGPWGRILTILAVIPTFVIGLWKANPDMGGETLSEIVGSVGKGEAGAIFVVLAVAGGVIGFVISIILSMIIFRPVALGKALKGRPCKERDRLQQQYEVARDKAVKYEITVARMDEILEEARALNE